jgi:S-disulfanyl-L-cysteine oxidoreductase SoxD
MSSNLARDSVLVALVIIAALSVRALAFAPQTNSQAAAAPTYTDEQSARGEAIYTKACGPCHDDKSLAPLLQGEPFARNWSDKNVGALFSKILTTMPLQDPGTLTDQQSIDLVAYILKLNRFSAGQEPLPKDAAALAAMSLSSPR